MSRANPTKEELMKMGYFEFIAHVEKYRPDLLDKYKISIRIERR